MLITSFTLFVYILSSSHCRLAACPHHGFVAFNLEMGIVRVIDGRTQWSASSWGLIMPTMNKYTNPNVHCDSQQDPERPTHTRARFAQHTHSHIAVSTVNSHITHSYLLYCRYIHRKYSKFIRSFPKYISHHLPPDFGSYLCPLSHSCRLTRFLICCRSRSFLFKLYCFKYLFWSPCLFASSRLHVMHKVVFLQQFFVVIVFLFSVAFCAWLMLLIIVHFGNIFSFFRCVDIYTA